MARMAGMGERRFDPVGNKMGLRFSDSNDSLLGAAHWCWTTLRLDIWDAAVGHVMWFSGSPMPPGDPWTSSITATSFPGEQFLSSNLGTEEIASITTLSNPNSYRPIARLRPPRLHTRGGKL
jgi:hypothetical protein